MKNLTLTICLTLAVFLGSVGTSWGADYDKGYSAYHAAVESGDFATALREWRHLAEQGDADAQYYLGLMYMVGQGVPRDYKTGFKWYTLSAEQGNANAQRDLGFMYYKGNQGVPQNDKTAVKWYTLAAEQGTARAQYYLGLMYRDGFGVLQDNVYALMWLNIAISSGFDFATKRRYQLKAKMTPADISAAQELAQECVRKKYKGC